MNYVLIILATVAMGLALVRRQWNLSLVALGLCLAPLLLMLDAIALFYHSLGSSLIAYCALYPIILLQKSRQSKKHLGLILLALAPVILLIVFKLFQWQGIAMLQWGLIITVVTALYLCLDRRSFDSLWFILLYLALAAGVYWIY